MWLKTLTPCIRGLWKVKSEEFVKLEDRRAQGGKVCRLNSASHCQCQWHQCSFGKCSLEGDTNSRCSLFDLDLRRARQGRRSGVSDRWNKATIFAVKLFNRFVTGASSVRSMAKYTVTMVRHGESAWNAENRFCGWFDADLAESGVEEAKKGAQVW